MPRSWEATAKPLYLGDNGRLTCGDLRCAGASAHAGGMRLDLSGGLMEPLTPHAVRRFTVAAGVEPRCETCGALASVLA